MRGKRTQKSSSTRRGNSVSNDGETSGKAALRRGEGTLERNGGLSRIRVVDDRSASSLRLAEDIIERTQTAGANRIARIIVLAGLGALVALTMLGLLEHFLERVVHEAVALSVPIIFGSITAAGITYLALRRQGAFHRRTLEERERTEDARREAERKYRDIFENAVEGVFQTSPDGGFITANPALARMLGFASPEELIRARDIEGSYYVHPERRVEFKRLLDRHDTVRGFEFEAYRKDGTKIWMSDNVRAVRDASGKLLYYEGTTEDITERKRAEEALRESEERFSRAFHSSPAPLIITRLDDGRFLNANDAFLLAFEYERAEVIGETVLDLNIYVSPEDR